MIDFEKIKAALADEGSAKTFLTDIANALQVLVDLLGKLFKAFAIKPKYADPDDELYAPDPEAE